MLRLLAVITCLISISTQAAPAMRGPLCTITGIIEKIASREEVYKDDEWRKSWSLPKSKIYTDITIKVKSSTDDSVDNKRCKQFYSKNVFQLRDDKSKALKGNCIKAQTQFSGDEFSIGQWLFSIEVLPVEQCS